MKNNIFKSRRFKHGTLATVLTAVFVAAVVLVNIIATVLLNRFPLSIDLTKEQSYHMSDDSVDFLKSIDRPVKIHVLMNESDLTSGAIFGTFYDTQIYNTLKQCSQYSNKISLDFIDLEKNPSFGKNADGTGKYGSEELSYSTIVVESDLRYRVISSINELVNMEFDYNTYSQYPASSKAEEVLMSAILNVTDEKPIKVANLVDFKELGAPGLVSLMEQNSYIFEDVHLLTEEIPDDVDMLLIAAPKVDYTQKEIDKIEKFLSNNQNYGKNLLYIASYAQDKLPVLEGYLKNDWNIEIGHDIVMETDAKNVMMTSPFYTLQSMTGNMFTDNIPNYADSFLFMPSSVPITGLDENTTASFIASADTCVLYPADADENWDPSGAEQKSFSTGVTSTRSRYKDGTELVESKVVAVGSLEFFLEDMLTNEALSNGELTVEMFNSLSGKESGTFNIIPKTENADQLGVTENIVNTVKWIFMIIVPIAVFAIGLIVWLRRKNK